MYTSEWVMAHIQMSHGTHLDKSWQSYACIITHIWMSHGTPINESCPHTNESWHPYTTVLSHNMWYSCPTYQWVMSDISMSHVPYMNESCPTTTPHLHDCERRRCDWSYAATCAERHLLAGPQQQNWSTPAWHMHTHVTCVEMYTCVNMYIRVKCIPV